MTEPKLGPRRLTPVVRTLLGGAVGFMAGGLIGLLGGWVLSPQTPWYTQLMIMMKSCGIGAMLGTSLGAAVGMLTGGAESDKSEKAGSPPPAP